MTARLPDFLGIGSARTGTTWLHEVLEGHVGLPRGVKETEFFTTYYDRGIEWYLSHFRHCAGMQRIGEICPYFGYPVACERIYAHIPNCKFLVTFRDPVERAYSHYKLTRRYRWISVSFEEALERNGDVVESTRYATHLRRWFERFGSESFLIQLYETLQSDPQDYIDRITAFLEVPRIDLAYRTAVRSDVNTVERAPHNPRLARRARHLLRGLQTRRAYRTIRLLERTGVWEFCFGRGEVFAPLAPDVDARVRERFRPEVEALEKLIGRDLSAWQEPRTRRSRASSAAPERASA
jgi:hypothetical protein